MSETNKNRGRRRLAVVGAVFTALGLIRRGKFGLALSVVGSNLAYHALRGNFWVMALVNLYRAIKRRMASKAESAPKSVDVRSGYVGYEVH